MKKKATLILKKLSITQKPTDKYHPNTNNQSDRKEVQMKIIEILV